MDLVSEPASSHSVSDFYSGTVVFWCDSVTEGMHPDRATLLSLNMALVYFNSRFSPLHVVPVNGNCNQRGRRLGEAAKKRGREVSGVFGGRGAGGVRERGKSER